jgi:hypothetical protein
MSKDIYTILLPWPSKDLSPNARVHHFVKASAAKKSRQDGWIAALASGARQLDWPAVEAQWVFFPPSRRHFDDDGLVSRCKAARDGVADAIGIDDHKWRMEAPVIAGTVKGGKVVLSIRRAIPREMFAGVCPAKERV